MSTLQTLKKPSPIEPNLPLLSPDVATAQLLVALTQGGDLSTDAFQSLIERNHRLIESPDVEIRESLARQALLLEGLWLHYTQRATACRRDDHAALLQKTALSCQAALNRTLSAIHTLDHETKDASALDA